MRLRVNSNCEGVGHCRMLAPDLFEELDDGTSRVNQEALATTPVDILEEAVAICPTGAIEFEQ